MMQSFLQAFRFEKERQDTWGTIPKPHPWLYSETCRIGLGIEFADRNSVIGIEDSGAGICSIRLAGYSAIVIDGGNIIDSGTKDLCNNFCRNFEEILKVIK